MSSVNIFWVIWRDVGSWGPWFFIYLFIYLFIFLGGGIQKYELRVSFNVLEHRRQLQIV